MLTWCPKRGRFLRPFPVYALGSLVVGLGWIAAILFGR